jgi:hypothetical protein
MFHGEHGEWGIYGDIFNRDHLADYGAVLLGQVGTVGHEEGVNMVERG